MSGADSIEGVASDHSGSVTMGQVAHEKLGKRLYTIGFTAHHGEVGNPNMQPWTLKPPAGGCWTPQSAYFQPGATTAFQSTRLWRQRG